MSRRVGSEIDWTVQYRMNRHTSLTGGDCLRPAAARLTCFRMAPLHPCSRSLGYASPTQRTRGWNRTSFGSLRLPLPSPAGTLSLRGRFFPFSLGHPSQNHHALTSLLSGHRLAGCQHSGSTQAGWQLRGRQRKPVALSRGPGERERSSHPVGWCTHHTRCRTTRRPWRGSPGSSRSRCPNVG